ncbi:MAG: glucose-6-phosphate dehydrogenase [Thermodesulfobacteriota bacterium]
MTEKQQPLPPPAAVAVEGLAAPFSGTCAPFSTTGLAPCTIVIFGATGDLAHRKLLPALYTLFRNRRLPEPLAIVGCGRTSLDHEAFRSTLRESLAKEFPDDRDDWPSFAAGIFYHPLAYDAAGDYEALARLLAALDRERPTGGNRMYYLAVPPVLYPLIAAHLGQAGLTREGKNQAPWVRIVVEKPFGRDEASAAELDRILHEGFQEHQIFRIDHYLAKETVQNILMLRFANTIFEPLWNRGYIDHVGIVAAEKDGIGHRAGYYEEAGVIRDMFQNHMMQLLALTALEPPSHFEAARVQDEKAKVFRSLKPFEAERWEENLVLGQYGAGEIDGRPVAGYRDEPGVRPGSSTPTFAVMRLFIDNWRWRGVPFYLASGKRLDRKETRIVIRFRQVPHSMFRNVLEQDIAANRLVLGIHPEEEISLTFQTKSPGARECLRPVTMRFGYYQGYGGPALAAYEKVLLDCIAGDHLLFWRQDGVELSWSFLAPILEVCEVCTMTTQRLHTYPAGSLGPAAARSWMRLLVDEK